MPLARAWVTDVFAEIGRIELVPAAQLGVSELVTNAILHARPPLTVSVCGTVAHPRIEVTDHAPGAIRPRDLTLVDGDEPTTWGRGLAMVAMNSTQWGSETIAQGMGKRVWFEPAERMRDDVDLVPMFEGFADEPSAEVTEPPADSVRVVLLNVPVHLFGQLRSYHLELRRELRLLALADPERYPLAVRISAVFDRVEGYRRDASGVSGLDDAIERGLHTVDVEYAVPVEGPPTVAELAVLLERTYEAFADDHLLAMAPPPELRALQTWYFGQLVEQGRGAYPVAWDGPVELSASSVC